jgi:lysozyme
MTADLYDKIKKQLTKHEGKRYFLYKCSAGFWTIGIGHNIEANPLTKDEQIFIYNQELDYIEQIEYLKNIGINDDDIDLLFYHDIEKVEKGLNKRYIWFTDAPEAVKLVMLDMAFNLGLNGLAKFVNTLAYIEAGQYQLAASNMLKSKWAGQVGQRAINLSNMLKSI